MPLLLIVNKTFYYVCVRYSLRSKVNNKPKNRLLRGWGSGWDENVVYK